MRLATAALYQIHGFQSDDAPHWSVAIVEVESPERARAILYDKLVEDAIDTVWGWLELRPDATYQDPETWRVDEWKTPVLFILGGGCR